MELLVSIVGLCFSSVVLFLFWIFVVFCLLSRTLARPSLLLAWPLICITPESFAWIGSGSAQLVLGCSTTQRPARSCPWLEEVGGLVPRLPGGQVVVAAATGRGVGGEDVRFY